MREELHHAGGCRRAALVLTRRDGHLENVRAAVLQPLAAVHAQQGAAAGLCGYRAGLITRCTVVDVSVSVIIVTKFELEGQNLMAGRAFEHD